MLRALFFAAVASLSQAALAQSTTVISIELRLDKTPYTCFATSCYGGDIERRVEREKRDTDAVCSGPFSREQCPKARERAAAAEQCASLCSLRARCKQVVISREERACTSAYFLY